MSESGRSVFLPWVDSRRHRGTLPADAAGHAPRQPASRRPPRCVVNDTGPASVPVQLMGPGDVTALAPQQVIRTDPTPGTRAFESNYFALVEFDEPACPGCSRPPRPTPAGCGRGCASSSSQAARRAARPARPRLAAGADDRAAGRPDVELPDLADSWAWAHAQVAPAGIGRLGAHRGARRRPRPHPVAPRLRPAPRPADRLPRVRRADVRGRPTGRARRRPGRRARARRGRWRPTWRRSSCPCTTTGSSPPARRRLPVAGARHPRPPAARRRSAPGRSTSRPPGSAWPTPTTPRSGSAARCGRSTRTRRVVRSGAAGPVPRRARRRAQHARPASRRRRPLLAPPRYGAAYRPTATLDPAAPARWYEQLNLDPAARVAAALGMQVVQREQETLVASAWDQAADLRAVVALGRLADAGIAVAERLQARAPQPAAGRGRRVRGRTAVPAHATRSGHRRAGVGADARWRRRTGAGARRDRPPRRPDARRHGASTRAATVAEPSRLDRGGARRCASPGPTRARIDAGRTGDARRARCCGDITRRPRLGAHAPGGLHRSAATTGVQRAPAVARRRRRRRPAWRRDRHRWRDRHRRRLARRRAPHGGGASASPTHPTRAHATRPAAPDRTADDLPEPPEPEPPEPDPPRPPRLDSPDAAAFRTLARAPPARATWQAPRNDGPIAAPGRHRGDVRPGHLDDGARHHVHRRARPPPRRPDADRRPDRDRRPRRPIRDRRADPRPAPTSLRRPDGRARWPSSARSGCCPVWTACRPTPPWRCAPTRRSCRPS